MTVKEAAVVLGWSPAYVRQMCKRHIIGDAYCNGKGERFTCVPFEKDVAYILGISTEELERRIKDGEK